MKRLFLGLAVVSAFAVSAVEANAGSRGYRGEGAHPSSSYYRGGAQVRGYVQRRGGYSYSYQDSINTYGNSRSLFGGNNAWRDFGADRQTQSGPFDHGFFFDSGARGGAYGGYSPYMH